MMAEKQDDSNPHFYVSRPAKTQTGFNTTYQARPPEKQSPCEKLKDVAKDKCSFRCLGRSLVGLFPVIDWLGHYKFKEWLVADFIAGITIAIFQIPQGMAYGMLAKVKPVCGLYTSFFPVCVYFLMGTSRQASVGTYAIVSLMTGAVVTNYVRGHSLGQLPEANTTNWTSTLASTENGSLSSGHYYSAEEVAATVALMSGLFQILMGVCHFGALSVYLSEHLVSGFTCASAVHVASSQLKILFGIPTGTSKEGILTLIYSYIGFFDHILQTNTTTMAISIISIFIMIVFKELINPKLKKYSRVPFPIELVMVIVGTVVSYFMRLQVKYDVEIVGEIEKGIPAPTIPPWDLMSQVVKDSIALAVVSFTSTISLAKMFAQKYKYDIDANQELLALGSANIFGSFFSCVPVSASLSRSSVQDGAGGKTQLVSAINCVGMLVVLLAVGPLLEHLPNCILSAIIVVALKGMIFQVTDFKRFWDISKIDGLTWLVTFLSVILLDVDIGLGVGVGFSLLTLIVRSQRPKTYLLGLVDKTDVYAPLKRYAVAQEIPGAKIFYFGGPLHFGNTDYFLSELQRKTGYDVSGKRKESIIDDNDDLKSIKEGAINEGYSAAANDGEREMVNRNKYLILDCSAMSYVDTSGITLLQQIFQDYMKNDITIYIAACPINVYRMLQKDKFFDVIPYACIFPTVHDAVLFSLHKQIPPQESNNYTENSVGHM